MHKWLHEIKKQKFTLPHQDTRRSRDRRGSGRGYKYSVVDLQSNGALLNTTMAPILSMYPPLFAFQPEHSLEVRCLYWYERGGAGEYCFVYVEKPFMNVRVQFVP